MEISKSLDTIKAVCDDAVANARFKNMEQVGKVMDAFDSIVHFINKQAEIIRSYQKSEPENQQPDKQQSDGQKVEQPQTQNEISQAE
jgi:hypothetical protein